MTLFSIINDHFMSASDSNLDLETISKGLSMENAI